MSHPENPRCHRKASKPGQPQAPGAPSLPLLRALLTPEAFESGKNLSQSNGPCAGCLVRRLAGRRRGPQAGQARRRGTVSLGGVRGQLAPQEPWPGQAGPPPPGGRTLTFSPLVPFRPRMPSAPYTNRRKRDRSQIGAPGGHGSGPRTPRPRAGPGAREPSPHPGQALPRAPSLRRKSSAGSRRRLCPHARVPVLPDWPPLTSSPFRKHPRVRGLGSRRDVRPDVALGSGGLARAPAPHSASDNTRTSASLGFHIWEVGAVTPLPHDRGWEGMPARPAGRCPARSRCSANRHYAPSGLPPAPTAPVGCTGRV